MIPNLSGIKLFPTYPPSSVACARLSSPVFICVARLALHLDLYAARSSQDRVSMSRAFMSLFNLCIKALGASVSLLRSQFSTQNLLENSPGINVASKRNQRCLIMVYGAVYVAQHPCKDYLWLWSWYFVVVTSDTSNWCSCSILAQNVCFLRAYCQPETTAWI